MTQIPYPPGSLAYRGLNLALLEEHDCADCPTIIKGKMAKRCPTCAEARDKRLQNQRYARHKRVARVQGGGVKAARGVKGLSKSVRAK